MSEFWEALRRTTPARIGLGRAGAGLGTHAVLEATTAHALARDAVHRPLDVDPLLAGLAGLGLGDPGVIDSAAPDRATYLTRPDLGRSPSPGALTLLDGPSSTGPDLAIVVADGLSAAAVERHAVPLLDALLPLLDDGFAVAPPVVARQARVALGDHVGRAVGAGMVLVLIGERPGLSASDSLGAYLTWDPRPGILDSARNCVSNIRPPHGLDHGTASRTLASLVVGARHLRATGVGLRPDTLDLETGPPGSAAVGGGET